MSYCFVCQYFFIRYEYRDIAHPINSDMRNMLESKVLAAYDAIEDEPAPETAE